MRHPTSRLIESCCPHVLTLAAGAFLCRLLPAGWDWVSPADAARGLGLLAVLALFSWLVRSLFRRAAAATGHPRSEAGRWACLLILGLGLALPYARPERVGGGDAQDYAEHVADFLGQTRQGVFPVFVGQSRYAFNGAFNPLRTSPYLPYFCGALDLLTLGALGPYALQNLALIVSLVAAAFACYLCLLRLAPRQPWICLLLAALYVSSPGVLALTYGGDMVPSWLALPYLPIAAFLIARVAEDGLSARRLAALALALAPVWLAHAPIAMWTSFAALAVIAVRLVAAGWTALPRNLLALAAAGVVFALLAGYVFVSVAELPLRMAPDGSAIFRQDVLVSLRLGWTGFLRPVSDNGSRLLHDLQLSPGLWACTAFAIFGLRRSDRGAAALLAAIAGFFLLLAPVPPVTGRIWQAMPVWVQTITGQWPMQRFCPIMSAFAPFAALLVGRRWLHRPAFRRTALDCLAVACLWSALEAGKFVQHGFESALSPDESRQRILPVNSVLAPYSYEMAGVLPPYRWSGPLQPETQLRLLAPASLEVIRTNGEAVASGQVPERTELAAPFTPTLDGAAILPSLRMEPGRDYLLEFHFPGPVPPGTLLIAGRDLRADYPLPVSGTGRSHGAANELRLTIALPAAATVPDAVSIRFVSAAQFPVVDGLGSLRVLSYRPEDLPLRLSRLIPYRAQVLSASAGWLETSHIFLPGYRVTVDGRSAVPGRSPDGLVMVRVPRGASEVEVRYEGTPLLRTSFWISFVSWLLLPAVLLGWRGRRPADRDAADLRSLFDRARAPLRRNRQPRAPCPPPSFRPPSTRPSPSP